MVYRIGELEEISGIEAGCIDAVCFEHLKTSVRAADIHDVSASVARVQSHHVLGKVCRVLVDLWPVDDARAFFLERDGADAVSHDPNSPFLQNAHRLGQHEFGVMSQGSSWDFLLIEGQDALRQSDDVRNEAHLARGVFAVINRASQPVPLHFRDTVRNFP